MLAGFLIAGVGQSGAVPKAGMVIRKSTTFARGEYRLANSAATGDTGALTIEGNNITVDFGGATLRGTAPTVEPNERKGTAIVVKGRNVTIKNVKVHGYQNGLVAFDSPGIKILDSDFSYNYKPRLLSTPDKEDLSDWMSYHHNDKDEWLKGGERNAPKHPAIYLSRCDQFEVKNVTAVGGGNGLLLNRSNKGRVWNSNLSYLSAVGLAMYRSSDNEVMHNRIDWCVRGFSYGKYNRGQDSAGILIYEQSHRNIFAYNSVTHGGDGFFLWAGQETMDSGKGGCNDNVLYANDFSHAPTNGIEVTFSRNVMANNLILECWHGIWGGYSFDSKIEGNYFGYNAEAIAIEHGQNNSIRGNIFERDHEGVVLWWNDRPQDPSWGYPKHRDTRSMDYVITDNKFDNNALRAMRISNTSSVQIKRNLFLANADVAQIAGRTPGLMWMDNRFGHHVTPNIPDPTAMTIVGDEYKPLPAASALAQKGEFGDVEEYLARFDVDWNPWLRPAGRPGALQQSTEPAQKRVTAALRHFVEPLRGGIDPFLEKGTLRGWRYMIVDDWGPYDFKRPMLRYRGQGSAAGGADNTAVMEFEVLGPKGQWRLKSQSNAARVPSGGTVPGVFTVEVPRDKMGQFNLQLEYVGGATTDYRGVVTPAGRAVAFGYERFELPIDWTVKFYQWTKSSNPADVHAAPDEAALQEIFKGAPLVEKRMDKLDFAGGTFDEKVGAKNFATVSTGTFQAPAGEYDLELTTDDGARVWLDDKPVITNAWKYQAPTAYTHRVRLGGTHRVRIEHFQIGGHAALKFVLKPVRK